MGNVAIRASEPAWKGREVSAVHPVDTSAAPRISVEDAWRRYQDGTAVFVDVRPRTAYEQSHIPGAISLPLSELGRRLKELPGDRLIVFY